MKADFRELNIEIESLRKHLPGGFDFYDVADQLVFPGDIRDARAVPPFMVFVTRVRQLSNSNIEPFKTVARPSTGNYISLVDIGDGDGAAWIEVDPDLSITRARVFAAIGELMKLPHDFTLEQIHGVEYHKLARPAA